MDECVFCHKDKIVTGFIYEDEKVMAFMDMAPINEGHVLLIPKEHYHLHIFPRYEGDGFGWTYDNDSKEVSSEIAKRIKDRIKQIPAFAALIFRRDNNCEKNSAISYCVTVVPEFISGLLE